MKDIQSKKYKVEFIKESMQLWLIEFWQGC